MIRNLIIHPLLSPEWIARLSHFNQLVIGFSGGLDSTVLLHVLASHKNLFPQLLAVHVNHSMSPNAALWQIHCEQFCQNLGIHFKTQQVQFDCSANSEERARNARYQVFATYITEHDCLILGHHLDDQAETVLLQLFRGAGVDGLAAMSELGSFGLGVLSRPFLSHTREQLKHYANAHQLSWIEDESNLDERYSRNYLRQQILPMLKKKWPGLVKNTARTALHCQQAKRNLEVLATIDLSSLVCDDTFTLPKNSGPLALQQLKKINDDRKANILRVWLKNNRIQLPSTAIFRRIIDEVLNASLDASPEVSWGEVILRRYNNHLYLNRKNTNPIIALPGTDAFPNTCCTSIEWSDFPRPLALDAAGICLVAEKTNQGLMIPPGAKIRVQFRRGGEVFFWHSQTKRLKKLFQEWKIPPWLREGIPLVYVNDTLAAVVGYAVSDLFFTTKSSEICWRFRH